MRARSNALFAERFAAYFVRGFSATVLVFLVVPILIVIPLSLSVDAYFSYPVPGWSFRWFETVLRSHAWGWALLNSLGIGLCSTFAATLLGTLAALGLSRPAYPLRGLVMPLVISPMITPIIVVAVGLYLVFAPVGLAGTYLGVILAHTALGSPFVVITVMASLASFDRNLAQAAAGLGADPWTAFRRVTLPLILPGVATGSVFAFATSFDEVVVILFIGGVDQRTIPRQMWSGIRDQINPSILVVATLLTAFAIALFLAIGWLRTKTPTSSAA